MMNRRFANREEAGQELARRLASYQGRRDLLVLALPRGGVPVAAPVAAALGAPLDLLIVRKLGVPGQEELAFGALTRNGVRVLNDEIVSAGRLTAEDIDRVVGREELERQRREKLYRDGRPGPNPHGKIVILVDDGLATGATMRAAVTVLLTHDPHQIIVAVPVAAPETCQEFDQLDPRVQVICLLTPPDLQAIGLWYDDFSQVSDEEVLAILARARLSGDGPERRS